MIASLWYTYSVTLFDNMGTFHILTDVILPIEMSHAPNVFSCSKTGPAPVWVDTENYSSTFYLVTLSEEIGCGRKNGEQKNA